MNSLQTPMKIYETGKVSNTLLLGKEACFQDLDYINRDASNYQGKLSDHLVYARLVINNHSAAVLPGQIVEHDDGTTYGPYKGTKALAGSAEFAAGIVSPYIPSAGAAVGEFYWLITRGPTDCQFDGNAIATIGSIVGTDASGQARAFVDGTDSELGRIGVTMEAVGTTAGGLYRMFANFPLS